MSKKLFWQIVLLIVIFCVAWSATKVGMKYALCGMYRAKCFMMGQRSGVVNSSCPMSGKAISKDTPHRTFYKGKTIGFCGSGCKTKFEANPEKYIRKIEK